MSEDLPALRYPTAIQRQSNGNPTGQKESEVAGDEEEGKEQQESRTSRPSRELWASSRGAVWCHQALKVSS